MTTTLDDGTTSDERASTPPDPAASKNERSRRDPGWLTLVLKPVSWHRARSWRIAQERSGATAGPHKSQIQVCPRGCYSEQARAVTVALTRRFGRADVRFNLAFQATRCPQCGAKLIRRCRRCKGPIFLDEPLNRNQEPRNRNPDGRCRSCGLPHPWAPERLNARTRTEVRKWKEEKGYATCLRSELRHGDLWVVQDVITSLPFKAIVSCDDVEGNMWTDPAVELKAAAGDEVERKAIEEAPLQLGRAWDTTAGALRFERIVHVATMDRRGKAELGVARECLRSALTLAQTMKIESLAVPAMGWGPADIELPVWLASIAQEAIAVLDRRSDLPTSPLSVVLVIDDEDDREREIRDLVRTVSHGRRRR